MNEFERIKLQSLQGQRSQQSIPSYRIGNFDPVSGLYEVLNPSGSVMGYGTKIYNSPAVYGDLVRATKPYGSNQWALDRIDSDKLAKKLNPTEDPEQPPEEPPEEPPSSPPPSNGFPTVPPTSPIEPPTTTYKPPKTPTPPNCEPPPKGCKWQDRAIPCNGQIQDFDYVRLNTGTRILCCDPSVTPPANGGCTPIRYSCKDGSCYPKSNGAYATFAECQAALIPPPFTGGQCPFSYDPLVFRTFNYANGDGQTDTIEQTPQNNGSFIGALQSWGINIIGRNVEDTGVNIQEIRLSGANGEGNFTDNSTRTDFTKDSFGNRTFLSSPDPSSSVYRLTSVSITIVSLTRVDGLDDDCGDRPPTCPI